jgi:regulator of sigma E protease
MPFGLAVFWGVVTFSILVFLHEGGHFFAARLFGVKVHEFMLGLPGPALRLHTKATTFGVTAIPLGGYVRIAGMEPGAEDPLLADALKASAVAGRIDATRLSEELGGDLERAGALLTTLADYGAIEPATDDDVSYLSLVTTEPGQSPADLLDVVRSTTYRGKKTWQRVVILSSGVAINIISAMLTFTVVLTAWGFPTATLTVESVQKGTAAYTAGLRAGDRLTAVDGTRVKDWDQFATVMAARKPASTIVLRYVRDGQPRESSIVLGGKDGHGFLGVGPKVVNIPQPVAKAAADSFKLTGAVFVSIVQFFANVVHPAQFAASLKDARSVVGVSQMAAEAAQAGPMDYAVLVALLSLSLGAMNILPIPPLDGGKVFLELLERAIGHPLKRQVALGLSAAGAIMLFSLIGYLMYADIARIATCG